MANIAQMINVLQAMIFTDGIKMVLTPTYYVFKMYVPLQDATYIPVSYDAGTYVRNDIRLPRLSAIAATSRGAKLYLAFTNLDPHRALEIDASLNGRNVTKVTGETLNAPAVDSVNSFEHPDVVSPKPLKATLRGGSLTLTFAPEPVTVVSVE